MSYQLDEVVIELTEQCNLQCGHCGSACTSRPPQEELSVHEWIACFDALERMGVKKLVCSGGEPTIKDGVLSLVQHLGTKSFAFGLITNGLHMPRKLLEALRVAAPFLVGVSVDGLKNTHNTIRGHERSFEGVMRTIAGLQDANIPVCAITTLSNSNRHELHDMAHLFSLLEINAWQLQLAMPSGRMRDHSDLLLTDEEFRIVCENVITLRAQFPKMSIEAADCFGPAPLGAIRSVEWWGCSAGLSSLAIDARGNVMPCLSMRTDLRCGNVRTHSLEEIWRLSKGFDFNRQFDTTNLGVRCVGCSLGHVCRGGCASMSAANCGSFHNTPYCFVRTMRGNRSASQEND